MAVILYQGGFPIYHHRAVLASVELRMMSSGDIDSEDNHGYDKLQEYGLSSSSLAALREFMAEKSLLEPQAHPVEDDDHPTGSSSLSELMINQSSQHQPSNRRFKEREYWEERFVEEEEYDWLCRYQDVASNIHRLVDRQMKILVIGCGNSTFSSDLYDDGYHDITSIDFSAIVIDKMREKHHQMRPEMSWEVMDMTDMSFDDKIFDAVIDKGAMDALMVDELDVWHPQQSVIEVVDKMCMSLRRVLKSQGKYIQISFAQPHFRSKYLIGARATDSVVDYYSIDKGLSQRYGWTVEEVVTIEKESGCLNSFLYCMIKL
jgi:EEF1A lysine methyltransferase 4